MVAINLPMVLIKQKYHQDIQRIRIEINKLKIKKDELDKEIGDCLIAFEQKNPDYPRKCSDLENEINYLSAKLRDHNFKETNQQDDEEHNPFRDALNKQQEEDKKKSDPELEKKCKDIFKEISKLTHPDVAKDPNLIPFFSEAKEALDRLDLSELQRIKDNVVEGKTGIDKIKEINNKQEEELKQELEILLNELKKERTEYQKILETVQFRIYTLSISEDDIDNMVANKIFLDLILKKIMVLKSARDDLTNKLEQKGIDNCMSS